MGNKEFVAVQLLTEIAEDSPVDGSTGYNYCKFCGGAWPDLNFGYEGHDHDCVWVRVRKWYDGNTGQ